MVDFGQQLRTLRSQFGMTQADLAQASNLGQSTISALETGRQGPWPSTRRALARAFNISLEEFDQATGIINAGDGAAPESSKQTATTEHEGSSVEGQRPWRVNQPSPPPANKPAGDFRYASAKVMELLNELGKVEQQLKQYELFVRQVCAACWTTDAALHITGAFGPAASEQRQRLGDFLGMHVGEFFECAWGDQSADLLPLTMHQKAADGHSVGFAWEVDGTRYMVYVDPLRDSVAKVIGTVGLAIDITLREMPPPPVTS